ncbi:MAG: porin [Planctomycetota bacterium]
MKTTQRILLAAGIAAAAGSAAAQAVPSLDESRGYAAELLADAERRTSLLGSLNHTNGSPFGFASEDGNFVLNLHAWNQTRFNVNFRDDANDDGFESGFSLPRTRIRFDGNIVNPDTTYVIEFAFDDESVLVGPGFDPDDFEGDTGVGKLLDAYFAHNYGNGFTVKIGQAKLPGNRESLIADNRTQLIESTVVDFVFTLDRSQFIGLEYRDEQDTFAVNFAFSDGARQKNSSFTDMGDGDFAFTLRGDFAVLGTVGSLSSAINSAPGGEDRAVLGAFAHYEENANGDAVDRVQFALFGVDGYYDSTEGWNIFGQAIGAYTDDESIGDEFFDVGFTLGGGFFVTNQTELFGSWDCFLADEDREDITGTEVDPFNVLQVGVNHYPFEGVEDVKLSAGLAVAFDRTTETGGLFDGAESISLLSDSEDPQFGLVGQVQIGF